MDSNDLFPPPQRLTPGQQERIRRILDDEISAATASGRPRRSRGGNRRRWWVFAAPLAAAAAVTAIAVTLTVVVPAGRPVVRPTAQHHVTAPTTARQVLLDAAAKVAQQHVGRYWHSLSTINLSSTPSDLWFAHDGTAWEDLVCQHGPTGKVFRSVIPSSKVLPDSTPAQRRALGPLFILGNTQLTYDVVQHWPTSATALSARIASYDRNKSDDLNALVSLELTTPAPPGVRAAAFRLMATLPGLQYQGAVKGGYAVYIPARDGGWLRLVIDPASGLIYSEISPMPGHGPGPKTAFQTFPVSEWSNQLPRVVPLKQAVCPNDGM
jgi:hypothetical protein